MASKITSVGGVHSLPTIFVGKNDGNRTLGEITGGGNAKGRGDAWNWKKGREKKKLVEIRSERERERRQGWPVIPSNLISKGYVRRDGVHHSGEFSPNGNRMEEKREEERDSWKKREKSMPRIGNLPEVPLYSLPSLLSPSLDFPIRLSAAFPRE